MRACCQRRGCGVPGCGRGAARPSRKRSMASGAVEDPLRELGILPRALSRASQRWLHPLRGKHVEELGPEALLPTLGLHGPSPTSEIVDACERVLPRPRLSRREQAGQKQDGVAFLQDRLDAAADAHIGEDREHELPRVLVRGLRFASFLGQAQQRANKWRVQVGSNCDHVAQQLEGREWAAHVHGRERGRKLVRRALPVCVPSWWLHLVDVSVSLFPQWAARRGGVGAAGASKPSLATQLGVPDIVWSDLGSDGLSGSSCSCRTIEKGPS